MHLKYYALQIIAAGCMAAIVVAPDYHMLHERRDDASTRKKLSPLDPNSLLRMHIGLRQDNMDNAHAWLMDVSIRNLPILGNNGLKSRSSLPFSRLRTQ